MAFFEDALEGLSSTNILLGVGVMLARPELLPTLHPLAKPLTRGGLYVTHSARGPVTEASEQLSDPDRASVLR